MKTLKVGTLFVAALLAFSCDTKKADDSKEVAEEQNEEKVDDSDLEKDAEYAVDVADASLLHVQASNLALNKATSADVKKFAQQMVNDHGGLQMQLKSVASAKNITLPDVMCEKCQKKFYDLDQKNKGNDFDKEYMDLMVKEHKDLIDKFEKEADKGNDAELKTWASEKLATLRSHLQSAEQIQDGLKK